MDLNAFLNNKNNLAAMAKALNSPEGRVLKEQLKNANRQEIMSALSNLGINSATSAEKLRAMANDPSVLAKLNEALNRGDRK